MSNYILKSTKWPYKISAKFQQQFIRDCDESCSFKYMVLTYLIFAIWKYVPLNLILFLIYIYLIINMIEYLFISSLTIYITYSTKYFLIFFLFFYNRLFVIFMLICRSSLYFSIGCMYCKYSPLVCNLYFQFL